LYKEVNKRQVKFKDQDSADLMPYTKGNKKGDVSQLVSTYIMQYAIDKKY
jgi:hypothetical protein